MILGGCGAGDIPLPEFAANPVPEPETPNDTSAAVNSPTRKTFRTKTTPHSDPSRQTPRAAAMYPILNHRPHIDYLTAANIRLCWSEAVRRMTAFSPRRASNGPCCELSTIPSTHNAAPLRASRTLLPTRCRPRRVWIVKRATQWNILGERLVDENRHIRLSTVDVELPDGVRFTQYVARMPRCAMTLVLNENREVLLMYRHRFIIDQWVWELPGGYVDHAEDVAVAAAREVEEETGWRPRTMEHLVTYQPSIGTLDQPQEIYLARGADLTDTAPDINEAEDVRWIPLGAAAAMIDRGEIVGAATVVAIYRALSLAG
ncbi:NUDIX hydrolase [Nocardia tengchongensis]|uniref:NUDIX hydrolase n=1 Tax=Nocardia tengchongensis TaxID=2055889 RepID=UPI0036763827